MKRAVTICAEFLWSGRCGCGNVLSYIRIKSCDAVTVLLIFSFDLQIYVIWLLTRAFHMCRLGKSLEIIWLTETLGIEYFPLPNTMLIFRLLKYDCFYFTCYFLHREQWCVTVLLCTLLPCVVKRGILFVKYVMYFVVTFKLSWVSVTVWLL